MKPALSREETEHMIRGAYHRGQSAELTEALDRAQSAGDEFARREHTDRAATLQARVEHAREGYLLARPDEEEGDSGRWARACYNVHPSLRDSAIEHRRLLRAPMDKGGAKSGEDIHGLGTTIGHDIDM
jgi:hypothetical protein